jgi:hypothetical protein
MARSNRSDPGSGGGRPRYPGSFLLAFREAVAELNWQVRRWLGNAVECIDENGQEQTIGLENLYRRARREPRELWPAFIADFLRRINAAGQADRPPEELVATAERLLVRLGQGRFGGTTGLKVWSHKLAGTDLQACLVIDSPETMFYVTEEMVTQSGQPGESWLEKAIANLRQRTQGDCLEVVDEDSGIRLCSTGDAYDAARVLLLDHLLPETQEFGCFVSVPSRDELLVLPVSARAMAFVHLLKVLAEKNFKSAPYPISDEVFWVRAGTWCRFPVEVRNQQVVVTPPQEFLPVFQRLAPDGNGDERKDTTEG